MKADARGTIQSALGLPCWQVRWDSQVGLDMNFGPPKLEIREPQRTLGGSARVRSIFARRGVYLRGSHWLVIRAGAWRLELADGLVVRDTSSTKRLDMAVARLKGEKLEGVAIDPRSGMTAFYFDLGGRIIVRASAVASENSEIWSLSNRRLAVAIHSGGSYTCTPVRGSPGEPTPMATDRTKTIVAAHTDQWMRKLLGKPLGAAV